MSISIFYILSINLKKYIWQPNNVNKRTTSERANNTDTSKEGISHDSSRIFSFQKRCLLSYRRLNRFVILIMLLNRKYSESLLYNSYAKEFIYVINFFLFALKHLKYLKKLT